MKLFQKIGLLVCSFGLVAAAGTSIVMSQAKGETMVKAENAPYSMTPTGATTQTESTSYVTLETAFT